MLEGFTMSPIEYSSTSPVTAEELAYLLKQSDWAANRSPNTLERMLRHTPCFVSARSKGRLIGFARALSDETYRALVEDVIVDEAYRGRGVGAALIELLLREHLSGVEEVSLACTEANAAFYERFGFKRATDPYMWRMQDGSFE